jgi:hypothetical protein
MFRLGICFRNPEKSIMDIRMTAGGDKGLRLFVCEETVSKQIQLVRNMLDCNQAGNSRVRYKMQND